MQTTREYHTIEDALRCLMTNPYDFITALQAVVAPHEYSLIVTLVARWLQTSRIMFQADGIGNFAGGSRLETRGSLVSEEYGQRPQLQSANDCSRRAGQYTDANPCVQSREAKERQGQYTLLWPIICAAMLAALDAYANLVAERLAQLDKLAVRTACTTTS